MTDKDLFLEPPEQILNIKENPLDATWSVVGSNSRVVKNWRSLVSSCPENAIRCYQHLSQTPMQRSSGRIFPLRGKKFKGELGSMK